MPNPPERAEVLGFPRQLRWRPTAGHRPGSAGGCRQRWEHNPRRILRFRLAFGSSSTMRCTKCGLHARRRSGCGTWPFAKVCERALHHLGVDGVRLADEREDRPDPRHDGTLELSSMFNCQERLVHRHLGVSALVLQFNNGVANFRATVGGAFLKLVFKHKGMCRGVPSRFDVQRRAHGLQGHNLACFSCSFSAHVLHRRCRRSPAAARMACSRSERQGMGGRASVLHWCTRARGSAQKGVRNSRASVCCSRRAILSGGRVMAAM